MKLIAIFMLVTSYMINPKPVLSEYTNTTTSTQTDTSYVYDSIVQTKDTTPFLKLSDSFNIIIYECRAYEGVTFKEIWGIKDTL